MLLEAPLNLPPRIVELDRLLQTAIGFVRMHFNDLPSVKLAGLLQYLQVVDLAQPKGSILTQPPDVKHLPRHPNHFQQPDYLSGAPDTCCVVASGEIEQF